MQVRDLKRLQTLAYIQEASHRDIAEAVGWKAHSYVGRLMRGQVTTVTPDAAVRIAHFFGVAIEDLFVTRSSKNPGRARQSRAA